MRWAVQYFFRPVALREHDERGTKGGERSDDPKLDVNRQRSATQDDLVANLRVKRFINDLPASAAV